MSSQPTQIRTVDPFADFGSDVVNRLTRMISRGESALMSKNSMSLSSDTTSPTTAVVVKTGMAFQITETGGVESDIFIQITEDHRVDMLDMDNYIVPGTPLDTTGNYYIVLKYTYTKVRPAPVAEIKILRPSERATAYPANGLLFLGVANVQGSGITFANYDSEYPDNKREYVKFYAGTETNLPVHETFRDQSRIAYDSETDKFWLGYENSWEELGTGGSIINVDTTGASVGQLCNVDSNAAANPALANSISNGADIAVESVGLAVDASGKGVTSGVAEDVPVETLITITAGDLLYLSNSEAGKVTNVKTDPIWQVVGRALTSGSGTIDMIFTPKTVVSESAVGNVAAGVVIDGGDWEPLGGRFYYDVNISALDVGFESLLTNFFDADTDLQIAVGDFEIRSGGDIGRIWMDSSSVSINYIISTGGGGTVSVGGGGGVADHSALLNLGFVASGHSGFAPDPHDNTQHAPFVYIEKDGVTFENLNDNGDVGNSANQVSPGNHDHASINGGVVGAGTVMLFMQASPPVGWTLLTVGFNSNSMLVLGTSFSQGGSQDARSYDPSISINLGGGHDHSITAVGDHTHTGTTDIATSDNDIESGSGDRKWRDHSHTFTTLGAGAHSHGGATGLESDHSHGSSYSTYDPYYVRVIAATKDV